MEFTVLDLKTKLDEYSNRLSISGRFKTGQDIVEGIIGRIDIGWSDVVHFGLTTVRGELSTVLGSEASLQLAVTHLLKTLLDHRPTVTSTEFLNLVIYYTTPSGPKSLVGKPEFGTLPLSAVKQAVDTARKITKVPVTSMLINDGILPVTLRCLNENEAVTVTPFNEEIKRILETKISALISIPTGIPPSSIYTGYDANGFPDV